MNNNYLVIYNNLIRLTRNKNLYKGLKNNDTFSDRLIILLFHLSFFLKFYKNQFSKKDAQDFFDFFIKQIELSIREIGYGDVSINKKMKEYVNLFYSILNKVEIWNSLDLVNKQKIIVNLLNFNDNDYSFIQYFDKYSEFLSKNSLKTFTKEILKFKF
tara:strand:+ start:2842 stop:3315 length:474 start_codon:yes stop_codon:yes gene_type:complete